MASPGYTIYLVSERCPICEEFGNLGFVKIPGQEIVSLMCDECSFTFPEPTCIAVDTAMHLRVPVRWASFEEIQASGFAALVSNQYSSSA